MLRTIGREPAAFETLMAELATAKGADRRYDAALEAALARWPKGPEEAEARWFVETLAGLLEASLLLRCAPPAVADAYCAARLADGRGRSYGALAKGADAAGILARV